MEARRWPAVLVSAALLALAAAAPAAARLPDSAYFKSRAWFNATISGTYVAHATEEDRQCYRNVGEDQTEPVTVTRNVSETLHFKSTRPVRFEADRYLDNSVQAGTLNRRTPVVVTTTRTFAESSPCDPSQPAPQCGDKKINFGISLISRSSPLRLYYDFNDGAVIFPDDPFDFGCRVPSVPWWGKVSSAASARMSGRKLFDKHLRRVTLRGQGGKSSSATGGSSTTSGRYDVSFTVTLVRTHR